MSKHCITIGLFIFLATTAAGWAQPGIQNLNVDGNVVTGQIVLPGVAADLIIGFEQVSGLTVENLGLAAELISPTDPALLARLPPGAMATIPAGFPVLLRFEPPPESTLSFTGVVITEIYTLDLTYNSNGPLRLFAGPIAGPLEDATTFDSGGSYRVRTVQPEFTNHQVIIFDPRLVDVVIPIKLDALELALAENADEIAAEVLPLLEKRLEQTRKHVEGDATNAAIQAIEKFIATVEQNSGAAIPDVWSAGQDLVNVAGELRARAETLRYTLARKANTPI